LAESLQSNELSAAGPQVLLVVIGPVVFGADLLIRYALVQHACSTGHHYVLHVVSFVCLLIVLTAALLAWRQYAGVLNASEEGGTEFDRTNFVSLLALLMELGCALLIIANAMPAFILSPCD